MRKKVILFDKSCADDLTVEHELLRQRGLEDRYELVKAELDSAEFKKTAEIAEGICAYTMMSPERLSSFPRAKVVALPALGADLAQAEAATEKGLYICNAPNYCGEDVAIHSVALILSCVRQITCFDRSLKEGRWNIHEGGELHRLSTMTHGLVSFGRIPREVARIMRDGFHVKLKAYDPNIPDGVFEEMGVERVGSIEELMSTCDIVSVHTPLFPDTHHLIGKKQFDAIADPIVFVVTSRGGVVCEDDLKSAIEAGKVLAAGVDVIEDEVHFQSVLTDMPQVTQTPHVAYYSVESDRALRIINLTDILNVLEDGKAPDNLLNRDVIGKTRG